MSMYFHRFGLDGIFFSFQNNKRDQVGFYRFHTPKFFNLISHNHTNLFANDCRRQFLLVIIMSMTLSILQSSKTQSVINNLFPSLPDYVSRRIIY